MGSRAVVLVCRSEADAVARFGVDRRHGVRRGVDADRAAVLRSGADRGAARPGPGRRRAAGLFDELSRVLAAARRRAAAVVRQGRAVAPRPVRVGRRGRPAALPAAVSVLEQAVERLGGSGGAGPREPTTTPTAGGLLARTRSRLGNADAFAAAYQRYCWPVEGLDGVRLAPFAVLGVRRRASHAARPHSWHLAIAARLAAADPGLFTVTRHVFADTSDRRVLRGRAPAGGRS